MSDYFDRYYNNPVSRPEKYGFEYVGVVDLSEPDYSFDLLAVLKGAGGYYLTTDSGCSCPTPWENHTVDDLTGPLTAEQAREEATNLHQGGYRGVYEPEEFEALMEKIV